MNFKNKRMRRKQRLKKIITKIKTLTPCRKCGESDPRFLTFHHKNPSDKKQDIRDMYNYSVSSIMKEINKCEILCRECHDLEHK